MPDEGDPERLEVDVETYAALLAGARHAKLPAPPQPALRQANLTLREWGEAAQRWQQELERCIVANDDAFVLRFADAYTAALTTLRNRPEEIPFVPDDRRRLPIAESAPAYAPSIAVGPLPHSPWDGRARAAGHGRVFVSGDLTSDAIPVLRESPATPFQHETVDAARARLAPPEAVPPRPDPANETLPLPLAKASGDHELDEGDLTLPFGVRIDVDG